MRVGSYLRVEAGGRVVEETDCYTCHHCRKPIPKATYAAEGAFCMRCGGPVCAQHQSHDAMRPAAQQIDEALERGAMWRRVGIS